MNYQEYVSKMKETQDILLCFIDKEDDSEENYQNLTKMLDSFIKKEKHILKVFLYLMCQISKNHSRSPNFSSKIAKVLLYLNKDINDKFTNFDIFSIFKSSKYLLLILIEEKIMTVDQSIYMEMTKNKFSNKKYVDFFYPELKTFIEEENGEQDQVKQNIRNQTRSSLPRVKTDELPDGFNEKRKIGENDNEISVFIRNDSIEEFITLVNKINLPLTSRIEPSLFETNHLLTKNSVLNRLTLIEYAAFFGSTQIFKYLSSNGVQLSPSLWTYAIHSDNSELIHILEENNVETANNCLKESIKCLHNDVTNYLQKKYFEDIDISTDRNILQSCFRYYNFAYFPDELADKSIFNLACQYDYFPIVGFYFNTKGIDRSELSVLFIYFVLIKLL